MKSVWSGFSAFCVVSVLLLSSIARSDVIIESTFRPPNNERFIGFSQDSMVLADYEGNFEVRSLTDVSIQLSFNVQIKNPDAVWLSRTSEYLAVLDWDTLSIWSIKTGKMLFELPPPNAPERGWPYLMTQIRFNSNGQFLHVIGDESLTTYDLKSGQLISQAELANEVAGCRVSAEEAEISIDLTKAWYSCRGEGVYEVDFATQKILRKLPNWGYFLFVRPGSDMYVAAVDMPHASWGLALVNLAGNGQEYARTQINPDDEASHWPNAVSFSSQSPYFLAASQEAVSLFSNRGDHYGSIAFSTYGEPLAVYLDHVNRHGYIAYSDDQGPIIHLLSFPNVP